MELIRHVILSTASVLRHQSESIITFTLAGRLHAFTCVLRRLCASRFSQLINRNNRELPTRIALLSYLYMLPTRLKFLNFLNFRLCIIYFSKNIEFRKIPLIFLPKILKLYRIDNFVSFTKEQMFLFFLGSSWASR